LRNGGDFRHLYRLSGLLPRGNVRRTGSANGGASARTARGTGGRAGDGSGAGAGDRGVGHLMFELRLQLSPRRMWRRSLPSPP